MTEIGQAALAVLDGGVFAGARVVELAGRVVGGARREAIEAIADHASRK